MRTEEETHAAPFAWFATTEGGTLVVEFHGELDIAVADECRVALAEPLAGPEKLVLLDLGGLDFADSTGLRLLVDTRLNAQARGKRVMVGPVSASVLKLFEVTGLTSWFEYMPGSEPVRETCAVCDGDIASGARRCPRCGCVL
jgi:anti-sigma B factor antagonist